MLATTNTSSASTMNIKEKSSHKRENTEENQREEQQKRSATNKIEITQNLNELNNVANKEIKIEQEVEENADENANDLEEDKTIQCDTAPGNKNRRSTSSDDKDHQMEFEDFIENKNELHEDDDAVDNETKDADNDAEMKEI